jgi:hypothetical protein
LFVFAGSVDPAKLKRVPLVSSPSASAPQIAADSNGRHWLDGVKHDPRYQSIERKWQDQKDIALLFNAGPNPASVKQYEEELRDFYAAWAVEHGHATHYLELRKSSEAHRDPAHSKGIGNIQRRLFAPFPQWVASARSTKPKRFSILFSYCGLATAFCLPK